MHANPKEEEEAEDDAGEKARGLGAAPGM